ncbi:MAG: type IV pilus assembly protein PilM [Fimbriimonadaceae bacterium]|nr:type IV pilus assembly protein PilM [Fimbriimonadaceae bacterium]
MAKKLSSAIGVDIGSQAIKVAEVRLQGTAPSVTALGTVPTPVGAVDHVGVHDPDAVGAALKGLFGSAGAGSPDVVVSIAGQGAVLVRTLEVPNMSDSELKQHMDWEITRNIPFAESTVVSDYKAFSVTADNPQNMDVVMAIAPQSAVDTLVQTIKKAGKKPAAIDVEPLGIARLLALTGGPAYEGKSVCVVHVGHASTAINIYKDGKLLMPRTVPVGGEMTTRAISESLGVTIEEAEATKRAEAHIPAGAASLTPAFEDQGGESFAPYNPFADPDEVAPVTPEPVAPAPPEPVAPAPAGDGGGRVFHAIAPVVDEFVAEVRRSIDYFRSKGGDVDLIVVTGGGAKLKGLDGLLQDALGLPTSILDPLRGLQTGGSVTAGSPEVNTEYTVAIGNALHIAF